MIMRGQVSLKEYVFEVKFDLVSFPEDFGEIPNQDFDPVLWPPDSGIQHRITGSDILLAVRL
jgi:hypothetical protein